MAAATASALPKRTGDWQKCLSQSEAESIVDQYASILTHSDVTSANATAQALLDDNYTEISDSILSLEGQPVSQSSWCDQLLTVLMIPKARQRYLRGQGTVH